MKKKLAFLIIAIGTLHLSAKAQNWSNAVDDEDWSFGYVFQYISAEYKILKNPNWRERYFDLTDESPFPVTQSINAISSPPKPGFGLGFLISRRITENFQLRVTPSLVLSDRIVRYDYETAEPITFENGQVRNFDATIEKKIQATLFELPLSLKLQSNKVNNVRAYFLGGAKMSFDLASKKKTFDDGESPLNKYLKVNKSFFSYEAALGMDFYFEYIKVSPEIKLSYTPNDVLQHSNTAFATPINKLTQRQLTFSLIFQ
ncbi:hypothetical protein ABIB40_003549 [Pedobacter sp. UYP30]|uniref:type IX secretion/gliding motility protein PorT/SprT n=1 Tax=Pedobacter sp. UYP30 TaxID=1756400 RepID=UPI0033946E28